jgi:hypothetical protein
MCDVSSYGRATLHDRRMTPQSIAARATRIGGISPDREKKGNHGEMEAPAP